MRHIRSDVGVSSALQFTAGLVLRLLVTNMPDRSTDMRIKQLSHEKAERVKKGIERLERHGQSS